MSDLWREEVSKSSIRRGRECDNCGHIEMSNRDAIKFSHHSDYKWARVQLSLYDYTQPSNKREYDLCSSKCYKEFALKMLDIWHHDKDCLGGIPLRYLGELLND